VDRSSQWQMFEDNRMIAEGHWKIGTRLASDADVITGYLRTFLRMLDHRRESEG
jgi:hypothetical protein